MNLSKILETRQKILRNNLTKLQEENASEILIAATSAKIEELDDVLISLEMMGETSDAGYSDPPELNR